ncbi:MAG: DNA-protecting protein DprA [Treponema sp.]|nr:DNA-protecting protein DprA [Treponema sp.]
MQTKTLFIAISAMDFLNLSEKLRLLKFMLSMAEHEPESALSFLEECSYGQIARISLRDPKRRLLEKSWKPGLLVKRAKTAALACQALGIKIELYGGKLYPPLLREICDPPFALYYRGALDVLFGKSVSVVGTRRLSPDGIKASRTFAYQAAQKGFCVVSGLAFGADGSAHQGAVDAFYDKSAQRVQTAAVLAGGVDNIFPPSHKGLAGKIIQNGGVVLSECPPCVPAEKWRFVQRNRIIAALSKATVVIQAPPGSGAMLTADFALGYNRELFFHEACFSQGARELSIAVERRLMAQNGSAAKRKLETSPQKYIDAGAQIIRNFEEFSLLT